MHKFLTQLSPRTLGAVVFCSVLGGTLAAVTYLYQQAVSHQTEMLRHHVSDLAQIIATSVEVDRHQLLVQAKQQNSPLYGELLAPLKKFHLRHDSVVYAYTIRVTDDGREWVVLDSTTDPEVRAHELSQNRTAIPSPLFEEYRTPPGHPEADRILRSGKAYVFVIPYIDAFGTFINARYPLFDSNGNYEGYAGIHFSLTSFEDRINEVRLAGLFTLLMAILVAVVLARTAAKVRQQGLENLAQIEKAESDMRQQRDRADKANTVKSEVLAIASHDLKNPLSAIAGISGLLLRRKRKLAEDEKDRADIDSLESIHDSSQHMTAIIKGLLLNEGLESGQMTIKREAVDLTTLASEVVKANRSNAERKNIELQWEPGESLSVQGDPQLLKESFDNYVNNALKYSPAEVHVIVSLQTQGDQVEFSVQDEGPGLSPDDQAKLFGKFQKLTARPTGGENSTGLGLSIVKTIAELHGGDVGCDSQLGQGARFWIRLPTKSPAVANS